MDTLTLIIIYLACGSPFGVYELTRGDQTSPPANFAAAISSFIFWPVIGVLLVWRGIRRRKDGRLPAFRIEQIRSEIECIAFANMPAAALFEFRDVYYRYTGLAEAAANSEGSSIGTELMAVTADVHRAAAAKCLARRNGEKLEFHKVLARNEFVDLISQAAASSPHAAKIVALASGLAEDLFDHEAVEDLAAMANVRRPTRKGSLVETEEEVWRSPIHSTSNIN